jgi:hypothetical protein
MLSASARRAIKLARLLTFAAGRQGLCGTGSRRRLNIGERWARLMSKLLPMSGRTKANLLHSLREFFPTQ